MIGRDIEALLTECHRLTRVYTKYDVDPNAEPAVALCFHRKITEMIQQVQFFRERMTPHAVNSSRLAYAEERLFHIGGDLNLRLFHALVRGRSSDQIDAAIEKNDDPTYVWWQALRGKEVDSDERD